MDTFRSFLIILVTSILVLAFEKYMGEKPPEERDSNDELSDWFVNEHGQIFEFKGYQKLKSVKWNQKK